MTEPKKRLDMSARLMRITVLRKVGELIGRDNLAGALGIEARSLRAKIGAERGIADEDLTRAAAAVDAQAQVLAEFAEKLRAMAGVK